GWGGVALTDPVRVEAPGGAPHRAVPVVPPPLGKARLTVSPVASASRSLTGRLAVLRSTSPGAVWASCATPGPSRYEPSGGVCSTIPRRARVVSSREAVDL